MHYVSSLILLSIFGLAMQTCGSAPTVSNTGSVNSTINTTASAAEKPAGSHADDEAPRITLAEAKKDFDAGNVVFVDTRPAENFRLEHVKGAVNIPLGEVEAKYKNIPAGKKIIAYCSWPSEHTSASLVQELRKKGIKNAYALVGGTKAWKDAGYPMESGDAK